MEKIYAPYYDYTKTPALSPDAPDEAVKAYQKKQELFKRKYAEAQALFFETEVIDWDIIEVPLNIK